MGRQCRKCQMQATFNFEGSKPAAYCKKHAEDGMVDVINRRCLHDCCTTRPSHNFEGSKPAAYCKKHAENGMVDVRSRRCSHDSCTKGPSHNFEGSKTGAYCKLHAEDGMVDVRNKRCLYDSCAKVPSYNFEGCKPAAYCKQHAEAGMVGIHNRRCLHGSCNTGSNYNFEGSKPAAYCKKHAVDGMVDVRNSRRLNRSCPTVPTRYSEDGMVVICGRRSKRSSNDSCTVVGAAGRVPADGVPTVRVRLKTEILDGPATSATAEELCSAAAGCLKRSRCGTDGEQPTPCLDDAPLEDGRVVRTAAAAAVEMALTKVGSLSSSSLGSSTHLNDTGDGGGTAAKRTRRQLQRRSLPP